MTIISNITSRGMERLKATYKYVLLGIVTAIVGVFIGLPLAGAISGATYWGLIIAEFAVLFWFMFRPSMVNYLIFTALTGLTLVPVLAGLLSAGAGYVILNALLGTAVMVLGLTHYATTTDKNYLGMGHILMYILIGVIVISLINIFFIGSSILSLGISIGTMVLFSFFIIYDTQQVIKSNIYPLQAAMNLYLDILNMFLALLNIFSFSDD